MSETERPGAPGEEEHEGDLPHPTPDDVPSSPGELTHPEKVGDSDEDESSGDDQDEDDGPDVAELDEDPAYDPDDPGLKGIKGG